MSKKPGKPERKAPLAQALARHKAAQAAYDARSDDEDETIFPLINAENDALKALAETPCASKTEFIEKLRYLLAHETRISLGPPHGNHDFGSIVVAVDRYMTVESINRFIVGRLEEKA